MSKKNIIFLCLFLVVIILVVFYLYKQNNKSIIVDEQQARDQAMLDQLNSFKPDPNSTLTDEDILKSLSTYQAPKEGDEGYISDEEMLRQLNEIKFEE